MLKTVHRKSREDGKLFQKRFISPGMATPEAAAIAHDVARLCAEDANTAIYVQEYNGGNYSSRPDYIDYLANRIQCLLTNNYPGL